MAAKKKSKKSEAQNLQPLTGFFSSAHLMQLLPYIAEGWAPVNTASGGSLCGLYAIERAVNEVWARSNPDNPLVSFTDLRRKPDRDRVATYIRDQDLGLSIQHITNQSNWFDDEYLQYILWDINREHGTQFRLGAVRAGRGDTQNSVIIYGDQNAAGPIVWILNTGTESEAHWSAFAPPPHRSGLFQPDLLDIFQIHDDAQQLLTNNNIYRIIPGDEDMSAVLAYEGEYVVAPPPDPSHNTPDNHIFVVPVARIADSDNTVTREIGNIPASRLQAVSANNFIGIPSKNKGKKKNKKDEADKKKKDAEDKMKKDAEDKKKKDAEDKKKKDAEDKKKEAAKEKKNSNGKRDRDSDDDDIEKPKAKKSKTSDKNNAAIMVILNESLDLNGVHYEEHDLYLPIGEPKGKNTLCRNIKGEEFEMPTKSLTIVKKPWGIDEMYMKPNSELTDMKYGPLRSLQSKVLGTAKKEESQKLGPLRDRLIAFYAKLQPLKILEVSWDAYNRQPRNPHYQNVYLLALVDRVDNEQRAFTASVLGDAENIPAGDLMSGVYVIDPWGLMVSEEWPSEAADKDNS